MRVATHAADGDHLVPDSLNIVACAEKLVAKALVCHAELLLHAALDANVDEHLLFLELLAQGGNLYEVVEGLEIHYWCSHVAFVDCISDG